jgi:hypothetical protein
VLQVADHSSEISVSDEAKDTCQKLAVFLFAYWAMLVVSRYNSEGITAFYDMMWQCNVSMVTTTIGLYTTNKQIIGAGIASVAID